MYEARKHSPDNEGSWDSFRISLWDFILIGIMVIFVC